MPNIGLLAECDEDEVLDVDAKRVDAINLKDVQKARGNFFSGKSVLGAGGHT